MTSVDLSKPANAGTQNTLPVIFWLSSYCVVRTSTTALLDAYAKGALSRPPEKATLRETIPTNAADAGTTSQPKRAETNAEGNRTARQLNAQIRRSATARERRAVPGSDKDGGGREPPSSG